MGAFEIKDQQQRVQEFQEGDAEKLVSHVDAEMDGWDINACYKKCRYIYIYIYKELWSIEKGCGNAMEPEQRLLSNPASHPQMQM